MNKTLIFLLAIIVLTCFVFPTASAEKVWNDLSATDTGDWVSTTNVRSVVYDSNNNLVYTGLDSGKFGVYNSSDDTWYNLSETDSGNWAGTDPVYSITYDSNNDLVYTGLHHGKLGVYNISDNIWYDLSATDTGDWAGTEEVFAVAYDSNNDLIYTGHDTGLFGVYNRTSNVWTNLSTTDSGNWAGTSDVLSITYDSNNDLVYTGLASGKLGVYNRTSDVWTNLSDTDSGWVGTTSVLSLTYDSENDLVYTGLFAGKFGVYNISDDTWYDLSATDSGDWVGSMSGVNGVVYANNDTVYTAIDAGLFGVYNRTSNNWIDLSAKDPSNWVSTSSVYSVTYDSNNDRVYTGIFSGKFGVYSEDSSAPSVTINSPLNITYWDQTIIFNVTATDNTGIDSCFYSLDGNPNITMEYTALTGFADATNNSMTEGFHNVVFSCDDYADNWNITEPVYFTINNSYRNVTSCMDLNISGATYVLQSDLSDVQGGNNYCLYVSADDITIYGNGFVIDSDDTSGNNYGIYVAGNNTLIENVYVSDYYGAGIYTTKNYTTVFNSDLISQDSGRGFQSNGGSYFNVSYNNITESRWGISVESGSTGGVIEYNTLFNQTQNYLIYVDAGSDHIIQHNNITSGEGGIALMYSGVDHIIFNNTISEVSTGIYLDAVTGSNITGNSISAIHTLGEGIHLGSSSPANNIEYNVISGYLYNLWVYSDNNTFIGNTLSDSEYNIYVTACNNSFMTTNVTDGNSWDLRVSGSCGGMPNLFNDFYHNITHFNEISYNGSTIWELASPSSRTINEGWAVIGDYYFNLSTESAGWVFVNVSYSDAVIVGDDESSIKFFKNASGTWTDSIGGGVNSVDIVNDNVYANISDFGSIFAPMERIGSSGGGGSPPAGGSSSFMVYKLRIFFEDGTYKVIDSTFTNDIVKHNVLPSNEQYYAFDEINMQGYDNIAYYEVYLQVSKKWETDKDTFNVVLFDNATPVQASQKLGQVAFNQVDWEFIAEDNNYNYIKIEITSLKNIVTVTRQVGFEYNFLLLGILGFVSIILVVTLLKVYKVI